MGLSSGPLLGAVGCEAGVPPGGILLRPGVTLFLGIIVQHRALGVLRSLLVLEFEGFAIGRMVTARCDLMSDPTLPDLKAKVGAPN